MTHGYLNLKIKKNPPRPRPKNFFVTLNKTFFLALGNNYNPSFYYFIWYFQILEFCAAVISTSTYPMSECSCWHALTDRYDPCTNMLTTIFLFILYRIDISEKVKKLLKWGVMLTFLFREKTFIELPKIGCILPYFIVFVKICSFQRRVKLRKKNHS